MLQSTTAIKQSPSQTLASGHCASVDHVNGLTAKADRQRKMDKRAAATAPRQATIAAAGTNNATKKIAGVKGAAASNATISESAAVIHPTTCAARLLMRNNRNALQTSVNLFEHCVRVTTKVLL